MTESKSGACYGYRWGTYCIWCLHGYTVWDPLLDHTATRFRVFVFLKYFKYQSCRTLLKNPFLSRYVRNDRNVRKNPEQSRLIQKGAEFPSSWAKVAGSKSSLWVGIERKKGKEKLLKLWAVNSLACCSISVGHKPDDFWHIFSPRRWLAYSFAPFPFLPSTEFHRAGSGLVFVDWGHSGYSCALPSTGRIWPYVRNVYKSLNTEPPQEQKREIVVAEAHPRPWKTRPQKRKRRRKRRTRTRTPPPPWTRRRRKGAERESPQQQSVRLSPKGPQRYIPLVSENLPALACFNSLSYFGFLNCQPLHFGGGGAHDVLLFFWDLFITLQCLISSPKTNRVRVRPKRWEYNHWQGHVWHSVWRPLQRPPCGH